MNRVLVVLLVLVAVNVAKGTESVQSGAALYRCPGPPPVFTDRISTREATLQRCALVSGKPANVLSASAVRKARDRLRQQVRLQLKDSYTARFGEDFLAYSQDGEVLSLCGSVNAKNSYGAYAGNARFVSTEAGLVVIEGNEAPGFLSVWDVWCWRQL